MKQSFKKLFKQVIFSNPIKDGLKNDLPITIYCEYIFTHTHTYSWWKKFYAVDMVNILSFTGFWTSQVVNHRISKPSTVLIKGERWTSRGFWSAEPWIVYPQSRPLLMVHWNLWGSNPIPKWIGMDRGNPVILFLGHTNGFLGYNSCGERS